MAIDLSEYIACAECQTPIHKSMLSADGVCPSCTMTPPDTDRTTPTKPLWAQRMDTLRAVGEAQRAAREHNATDPATQAVIQQHEAIDNATIEQAKVLTEDEKKRAQAYIDAQRVAQGKKQKHGTLPKSQPVPKAAATPPPPTPPTPPVDPTLEEQEIARRILARRNLLPFVQRFQPDYDIAPVHEEIAAALKQFLQDVIDKKSPRLMILMPPRAGKSTLASHFFPAWAIGQYPWLEFIASSYSQQLALDFSRLVLSVIRDEAYAPVFPDAVLSEDNQSVERWKTTKNGAYAAVGVGGAATGRGSHIFLIDDPVKNAEDAESFTKRTELKNWYQSTAFTRLAPGGGVLCIQTCWHMDDLAGWLQEQMRKGEGEQWQVLRFPAIAVEDEVHRKKGEALHPARYPLEALLNIKKVVGSRVWAALYQQNPAPDDGAYFKKDEFVWYDALPEDRQFEYYMAADLAIGQKQTNDYTALPVAAVDQYDEIWLMDWVYERMPTNVMVDKMLDKVEAHRVGLLGIEKGQLNLAIRPELEKRMAERKTYVTLVDMPARADKQARARSIQARMQRKKVHFPRSFENSEAHIDMLRFPNGVHDDFSDGMAHLGQMIENMVGGRAPVEPKVKSWRDNLHKYLGSASKKSYMAS